VAVVQPNGQAPETPEAEVYNAQLGDEVVGPILRAMQGGRRPTDAELARERKEVRQLAQQWEQLIIHNQSLYRKFENAQGGQHHLQLVAPRCMQHKIIQEAHSGVLGVHLGEEKTLNKMQERFYWPGYSQSIKEWCLACPHCAARKSPHQKNRGALQNIKSGYPKQIIAMDIRGPSQEWKQIYSGCIRLFHSMG